jgi:hypothetical protein
MGHPFGEWIKRGQTQTHKTQETGQWIEKEEQGRRKEEKNKQNPKSSFL